MAKVPPPYMTSARTGAPLVTPEDERALRKLYQRQRKVLERAIAAQGGPFADKFAHLGNIELDFEASLRSSAMMTIFAPSSARGFCNRRRSGPISLFARARSPPR